MDMAGEGGRRFRLWNLDWSRLRRQFSAYTFRRAPGVLANRESDFGTALTTVSDDVTIGCRYFVKRRQVLRVSDYL